MPTYTPQQIDAAIKATKSKHYGFGGNCAAFAVVLNKVLGGSGEYLCADSGDSYEYVDHVALQFEGHLYDGDGLLTRQQLLDYARSDDDDDEVDLAERITEVHDDSVLNLVDDSGAITPPLNRKALARALLAAFKMTVTEGLKRSDLEIFTVKGASSLKSLVRKYGWVRLMLEPTALIAWDAGDFTHGDYEEVYGDTGLRLNIACEEGIYKIEFDPNQTNISGIKQHPIFARLCRTEKCVFIDHNTWEIVNEDVALPSNLPKIGPHSDHFNPALLTKDEYLEYANQMGRYHEDSSYDSSYERMQREDYLSIKHFPKLLRQFITNGVKFQVRLTQQDAVNTIVAIFNDEKKVVAALQDEFGCVLIRVAKEYRGFNLGVLLGKIARTMYAGKTSGGFTPSGERNFVNVHRELVRDALTSGFYREQIKAGTLTIEEVRAIIDSLGLKKKLKPQNRQLAPSGKWLLYGEHGAFVLYDRGLRDLLANEEDEHFVDKMIKGYVLVRCPDDEWALTVKFGGDNAGYKSFMLTVAVAYAEHENGTGLHVDEVDLPFVNRTQVEVGELTLKTGIKRALCHLKADFDYESRAEMEAIWRRSFDRYGEFHQTLIELAESKFQPVIKRDRWGNIVEGVEDDPKFRQWFGNSKVVDANGLPLRVFHATSAESFDTFRKGANYFTDRPAFASRFGGPNQHIYPVYLKIENPYMIDAEVAGRHFEWDARDIRDMKAEGHDGVIIIDPRGDGNIYTPFNATQIKSVFNKGTWDGRRRKIDD